MHQHAHQHHHHGSHSHKRERTASPPLRAAARRQHRTSPQISPRSPRDAAPELITAAETAALPSASRDPVLAALLQDSSFNGYHRSGALLYDDDIVAGTPEYARMQALQDVLRRTSLTEFRDREIAEWLQEMEAWLHQSHTPGHGSRTTSGDGAAAALSSSSSLSAPTRLSGGAGSRSAMAGATSAAGRGAMNADIRIAVLGVLDTLPWWRLVEGFAEDTQRATTGDGVGKAAPSRVGSTSGAAATHRRPRTVPHSFIRWHEKIQINFERVCIALIDQSPRAVQGVLEVLMRPFRVRPPVRDGAERSMPCDSVIRVLNHVATRYPPSLVLDTLDQSMSTLVPKQRWPDRRHHVACVAILLHLALESHVPMYTPQRGNQQSFSEARERFFSAPTRASHRRRHRERQNGGVPPGSSEDDGVSGGGGREYFRLPPHAGGTSEESSTDASTTSTNTAVLGRVDGVPSGYRSASGLFVESGIRLPPRSLSGLLGASDGGAEGSGGGLLSSEAEDVDNVAASLDRIGTDRTTGASKPKLLATENPYNNKILAYRNELIRFLLRHLLAMELTLERTCDAAAMEEPYWLASRAGSPYTRRRPAGRTTAALWNPAVSVCDSQNRTFSSEAGGGGDGGGAEAATGRGDRSGVNTPLSFPESPITYPHHPKRHEESFSAYYSTAHVGDVSASGAACGSAPGGDGGSGNSGGSWSLTHDARAASAACAQLTAQFTPSAKPFFKILLDCTTLVFDKLSADLRRQQAAGACGNADWWRELIVFHTHATLRTEAPVCLLYLAPSLALRGVGGEAADILHKLISVVTKGVVPPQLQMAPRSAYRTTLSSLASSSAAGGGSAAGMSRGVGAGGANSGVGGAQPVRMRMAPPTAGGGMHAVPLEQRLRAAFFIFPLFRFLRSRVGGEEEGLRRRLLKWMAHERRKVGTTCGPHGHTTGASSGGVGSFASRRGAAVDAASAASSGIMELVDVVFAQCAAISELLNVDMVVVSTPPPDAMLTTTAGTTNGAPIEGSAGVSTVDAVTEALEPLLAKYTLQSHLPVVESTTSRKLYLDLHQLEIEGLLRPNMMGFCPWSLIDSS